MLLPSVGTDIQGWGATQDRIFKCCGESTHTKRVASQKQPASLANFFVDIVHTMSPYLSCPL